VKRELEPNDASEEQNGGLSVNHELEPDDASEEQNGGLSVKLKLECDDIGQNGGPLGGTKEKIYRICARILSHLKPRVLAVL
jgi:hypothetical protein